MKQLYTLGFLLAFVCSGKAGERAKLSPLTQEFLYRQQHGNALPAHYVYRSVAGQVFICALIKVDNQADAEAMKDLGVRIGTRAGDIWTVQVPVAQFASFTTVKGIGYIQVDEPVHSTLDSARRLTRTDSVHAGLGALSMPYHGDNVVVGIIDAGFDYRHPVLFDTTGSRYRVKRIWEQTGTGTPPAGFTYGHEITDTLAMWNKGNDMLMSHGAHVSGIAAGSGYGSQNNSVYRGIADAADLVLVGITPPSSDWTTTGMSSIIDGMNYIYNYAASVGKPAVVNLSWGCSIGAHDGRSLFSQACDNLTGAGRIFVVSAGNNGSNNLHVQKVFSATDTLVNTFVTFSPSLGAQKTWVDIWGDSSQSFCVQLSLCSGPSKVDSTVLICLDNQLHNIYLRNGANDTLFANITTSSSEFNGKPRIFLDIYNKASERVLISVRATGGKVNMWTGYVQNTTGYYGAFVSNGYPWAVNGNNSMTVGDMASTRSALTVGAYSSRVSFTDVSGNNTSYVGYTTYGNHAPFTSRGPTADGRIKPDIMAPGLVLGSAVNSYDSSFMSGGGSYTSVVRNWTDPQNGREYSFAMLMGTSMSAPVASGIVALMLQANPGLTPQEVQLALAETAITDSKTGNLPSQGTNLWGHGKINAMGAVQRAATISNISHSAVKEELTVFPNPAGNEFFIGISVPGNEQALLEIYDITGRRTAHEYLDIRAGYSQYRFNTKEWGRGVYFIRLSSSVRTRTSKLILE